MRRKLVKQEHLTGEINDTSRPYLPEESLYTLQILRLKGFDAGKKHNFGIIDGNTGLYDGVIDTWACDASQGFFGHGQSVS
ncbi:hypothetical protein IJM86_01210 [bacterium]|nr:hypothetical protein [bacterium]